MAARLVVLAALCVPSACAGSDARPNVVLVVVDSLRADHLSAYGHERPTPGIDALAAGGTLFERAYATAPWTMPSVATMLTGLHPTTHGVTNTDAVLAADVDTLAELFRAAGYRTAAVVSHHLIGRRFRFDQGFDAFDQEAAHGHKFISSELVTEKAERILRETALSSDGRPLFLFAHYFDPHYDYRDHPEIAYARRKVGRLDGSHGIGQLRRMLADLTPAELGFLRDRYDEEILHTDRALARLFAALAELGLEEDTLVAFTADHGEEFRDHGWLGHERSLYQELLHVPLALRGPGVPAGARIAAGVSLVDLAPTLLDLAGVTVPGVMQGSSLAPLLAGEPRAAEFRAFGEIDYLGVEEGKPGLETCRKKAIVGERYKLVRDDLTGALELFDLELDPLERLDLSAADPERTAALAAELERHLLLLSRGARRAERTTFTQAELETLRELGYVGDE